MKTANKENTGQTNISICLLQTTNLHIIKETRFQFTLIVRKTLIKISKVIGIITTNKNIIQPFQKQKKNYL